MGKGKKKSHSNKNAERQQDKGQKHKTPEETQVQNESTLWDADDSFNSEKKPNNSNFTNKSCNVTESVTTDISLNDSSESNDNNGSDNKNRNHRSDNASDYKNFSSSYYNRRNDDFSFDSRKSEPAKGSYREEVKRYRHSTSSKRIQDDSDGRNRPLYQKDKCRDPDFHIYYEEFRSHRGNIEYDRVIEITKNLFDMDEEYALAHCVAEDFNMGSGIAVQFRRDFKRVDELLQQRQTTGGLAILQHNNRYVYYLVTKMFSYGKPTYETLFSSLKKLRKHINENDVRKLAMPRIGCGLDRLEWPNVKFMIEHLFKDVDIEIVVCNIEQTEDSPVQQKYKNSRVENVTYPIEDIEAGTVIIYFSSEDGAISDEMEKLDEKFHFFHQFRPARKNLGDVVFYSKNENYLVCGCIVKRTPKDQFDFTAFQKCLSQIQKENKKFKFYYYGFQAIREPNDERINYKIINILRNTLYNVEIYVCWPGDLQDLMSARDRSVNNSFNDSKNGEKQTPTKEYFDGMWKSKKERSSSGERSYGKYSGGSRSGSWRSDWRSDDKKYRINTPGSTESKEENWDDEYQQHNESFTDSLKSEDDPYWKGSTGCENRDSSDHLTTSPGEISREQERNLSESTETNVEFNSEQNIAYWDQKCTQVLPTTSGTQDFTHLNPEVPCFVPNNQTQNVEQVPKESYVKKDIENLSERCDNFTLFMKSLETVEIQHSLIKEQNDLSKLPKNCSRVCFAREDLMFVSAIPPGADIARRIGEILDKRPKVGNMIFLKEHPNFCYLLIISEVNNPATLANIFSAIEELHDHVKKNHRIEKLVIPKLDINEDFARIKAAFQYIFGNLKIELIFAPFEPVHNEVVLKKIHKNKIIHGRGSIHQMKKKSGIVYLASADNSVTVVMNSLEKKFEYLDHFKKQKKKSLGDVIRFKRNEEYVLYGCIVHKVETDPINFEALQKCMLQVKKQNETENYQTIGIQAVECEDETINYKIMTVLLNTLDGINITMCWPGALKEKMPVTHKS